MASAARLGGQREGETRSLKSVIAASFIGTTIEWYDFFLYGTAAALVFDKLFFPEAKPLVGTLLAFSTYAVGFAARPLAASPARRHAWHEHARSRSYERHGSKHGRHGRPHVYDSAAA